MWAGGVGRRTQAQAGPNGGGGRGGGAGVSHAAARRLRAGVPPAAELQEALAALAVDRSRQGTCVLDDILLMTAFAERLAHLARWWSSVGCCVVA